MKRWYRIHFETKDLVGDTAIKARSVEEAKRLFKIDFPTYHLTLFEISEE